VSRLFLPVRAMGRLPLQRATQGQIRIQKLLDKIIEHTGSSIGRNDLIEQSLTGYFLLFRSSGINRLEYKTETHQFRCTLWKNILNQVQPEPFHRLSWCDYRIYQDSPCLQAQNALHRWMYSSMRLVPIFPGRSSKMRTVHLTMVCLILSWMERWAGRKAR